MNIRDVERQAQDDIRERIAFEPTLLEEDFTLTDDIHDTLSEIADSCVPVYNHDRALCLADDPSLAYPDEPDLAGDSPDVWTLLGISIYGRAYQAATEHAQEVAAYLPEFVQGYTKALIWTDAPELTDPADIDCIDRLHADCVCFVAENYRALDRARLCDYTSEQAGHDFALTRNGHGTGYWDRDEINDYLVHGMRGFERFADDPTRSLAGILADAATATGPAALLCDDDGTVEYFNG